MSPKYRPHNQFDYAELKRKFWKNPLYGADVCGSISDKEVTVGMCLILKIILNVYLNLLILYSGTKVSNINKLGTILDHVYDVYTITIEGVNTAYLYFGMWRYMFSRHTEDMDLYSINYIHHSCP